MADSIPAAAASTAWTILSIAGKTGLVLASLILSIFLLAGVLFGLVFVSFRIVARLFPDMPRDDDGDQQGGDGSGNIDNDNDNNDSKKDGLAERERNCFGALFPVMLLGHLVVTVVSFSWSRDRSMRIYWWPWVSALALFYVLPVLALLGLVGFILVKWYQKRVAEAATSRTGEAGSYAAVATEEHELESALKTT